MDAEASRRRSSAIPRVELIGVTGIPEVEAGDDLASMIVRAAVLQGTPIESGDVLVVTQKIVSKAEGRVVDLKDVSPSPRAREIARESGRDSRLVELVLRESRSIVRMEAARGVIITETRHGFVCANAGIDASNVPGEDIVTLLPEDPDASARRIGERIQNDRDLIGLAVIISDTFGRAWREGQVNFAVGVWGMNPLRDYAGTMDSQGKVLRVTNIAIADELASASELVEGKSDGVPAAIVRGYGHDDSGEGIAAMLRDRATDLFR
jgi:coenzyme F420-0:L-glutamate ligase/coenzyme F420-1:gamma-L-glutamate ligase